MNKSAIQEEIKTLTEQRDALKKKLPMMMLTAVVLSLFIIGIPLLVYVGVKYHQVSKLDQQIQTYRRDLLVH